MEILNENNKENGTPNKRIDTVHTRELKVKRRNVAKCSKTSLEHQQSNLEPKPQEEKIKSAYQTEQGKKELLEIWFALKEKEHLNKYNYNEIINLQTDINAKMRSILIDWLISVHSQLRLKRDTLFLCANIIDRYISQKIILRSKFQLLGITALFVASKYEEIFCPPVSYFVDFTAKTFSKEEILEMESTILSELQFELNLPFSNDFFEILSIIFNLSSEEKKQGYFLLEAFLLMAESNLYLQSDIAKGACYIILKMSGKWNFEENQKLIELIFNENGSDFGKIISCSRDIFGVLENKTEIKSQFKAVFEKYGC